MRPRQSLPVSATRGSLGLSLLGAVTVAALLATLICPGSTAAEEATDRYRIALVTVDPGELYWERFGHNALLVADRARGSERLFNFGLFDFAQENFLLNFVRGRMRYTLATSDPQREFAYYPSIGRTVTVQELALSPRQAETLARFLDWHLAPPNDSYLYDYLLNNCSTKVRDALDLALDGQLAAAYAGAPARGGNFRDHTQRLTSPEPWLYLGTHLGLGRSVDRPISRWEEFFIPMALRTAIGDTTIAWEDGSRHRLVAGSTILEPERPVPVPTAAPSWWPWFLLSGLVLAALILGVDRAFRRPPLSLAWWIFGGLIGAGLAGLWAFTDHQAAYRNENLLLFSPFTLLALAAAFGHRRAARLCAGLAVAGCAVAGALKLAPLSQDNLSWLALAAPAHLAAAWIVLGSGRVGDRHEVGH